MLLPDLRQRDKQKHLAICFLVSMIFAKAFSVGCGFSAGVFVAFGIEAYQWGCNRLLAWMPEVFDSLFEVRKPDLLDAIAGCYGAVAGTLLVLII